jgi:glycosyltransferase involved in cell wall biosynthesis
MAARTASSVVAISQSTGSEMQRYWGKGPDAVVHPRIDRVFRSPVSAVAVEAAKVKYQLNAPFFFTLGTLEPRKNLRALMTAYADARTKFGAGMPQLILAGNPGWLDGEIRALVDRLTAEGSVRWLGYVPLNDLPALYMACQTFVFVPIYEGFGMPVREALLCGARVLASDIAALREAGGDAPEYVPPDVVSLREALLREAGGESPLRATSAFDLSKVELGSATTFMRVLSGLAMVK